MDRKNSCLTGVAYAMMALILLTYPVWRYEPEEEQTKIVKKESVTRKASTTSFQYALPAEEAQRTAPVEVPKERILHQLDRHARNEANGFYDRVVLNPEMPEEVRSRFAKEKERLDRLAEEHPEEMQLVSEEVKAPLVKPDGSFTPEFEEAVKLMQVYGVWDQMADAHVEQLIRDSRDPDIPEESRPTAEDIEAARKQRLIPVM